MKSRLTVIQIVNHIACMLPLILILVGTLANQLTFNPIREATLRTGRTALTLLLLSFATRPIRNLFDMDSFLLIGKDLGLYAAFYALIHFFNFIGRDYQFAWADIFPLITNQTFLQVGLTALGILLILLFSSTPFFQRRFPSFWKNYRFLVYGAFGFALLHYYLAIKGDKTPAFVDLFIFLIFIILQLQVFKNFKIHLPFSQKLNTLLNKPILHHV
jgi:methionine sulfoxide reductase heme-binding subunit